MGSHKGAHLAVGFPADAAAQQFDLVAAAAGVGHVGERDVGDALGGNLFRVDVPSKAQGGQDADLPAGVVSLDVGGGVGLGVAFFLGLL